MVKTMSMEGGRGESSTYHKSAHRFGEVVGGTAAECAAVCCCCPCTVVHLLVLTIFKMPVCLCRKAHKRHRIMKKKKKLALLGPNGGNESDIKKLEREVRAAVEKQNGGDLDHEGDHDREVDGVDDLENEMWARFYSTGFWRSPSQRSGIR